MKKNSILKAIGIAFLVYVVLSWIIPGGTFSELNFSKDTTYPLGLGDIIYYPFATLFSANFAGIPFLVIGIIFLLIGGLYGVLNKTGAYANVVNAVVKKFESKKHVFLIISILTFAILASLTTLSLPLFILVPFAMTVILLLGYDKVTALLSTVGAILVGNMATVYGYNTDSLSYFNILFNINVNALLAMKIVLFVVSVIILTLFVLYSSKEVSKSKKKKTSEVEITLYSKEVKSKKSGLALVIVSLVLVVFSLVSMYAWEGAFKIDVFKKMHEGITTFSINNYKLFADILGTNNKYLSWTIGTYTNYDLVILIMIATVVIGLIYKLSLKDIFEGALDGMKQMLKVALLAVLANVIYLAVINATSASAPLFINSIANRFFTLAKGMNYFVLAGVTMVSAPLFNEFPYLVAVLQQPLLSGYTDYSLLVVIMQTVYGFMMLVLPTSVILVAGMSYADVSIKEYFKKSWLLLLGLLIAVSVVILLFMYCPGIKVM